MKSAVDRLVDSTEFSVGENILKIPMTLDIVIGSVTMTLSEVLNLRGGATLPLDRKMGQPVDLKVNSTLIGRADLLVCDGEEPTLALGLIELAGIATR